MGAWSTSITGNDTAQDLRIDYQCAFYYNDVDTALSKIDAYIRREGFCETDESDWCDYYYSLADFMWNKGILTDTVRDETLQLIDSGFGLDIWEEAGEKILEKRKKVLKKFRDKIVSAQPEEKKIKIDMYTKPIFNVGDVVAIQFKTLDSFYCEAEGTGWYHRLNEPEYRALDGKYMVIKKVSDHISFTSQIEPAVRDIWPTFELYDTVFDNVPSLKDIEDLGVIEFPTHHQAPCKSFICEGSMFYFKKRNYVVIGNLQHKLNSSVVVSRPQHINLGKDDFRLMNALFPIINNE